MPAFASSIDLMQVWRPLTDEEQARAEALLQRASRRIRRRWPDVDSRIATGSLDADDVADVVLEMVQTAMTGPQLGVDQASQTAGPFSESVHYVNPAGRLYFTADMARVFEGESRVRQGWVV